MRIEMSLMAWTAAILFALLPAETSWAEPAKDSVTAAPRSGGARMFETLELAGEAGIFFPLGRLRDVLDPAPMAGLRATTSYYGNWRATAGLSAVLLEGPGSPASVALALAAAGLEWRGGPVWIPKPALALGLAYVRTVEKAEENGDYLFMDDGESEFGIQSSLLWMVPFGSGFQARAGARWDMMFTSPVYSHAASILAGTSWTW